LLLRIFLAFLLVTSLNVQSTQPERKVHHNVIVSERDPPVRIELPPADEKFEAGSDREHIESLVHNKGYQMPSWMMYVRLVHLLDPQKRQELMIIYGENLAVTGVTEADLQQGGKAYQQWPDLAKRLTERAKQHITIEPLEAPKLSSFLPAHQVTLQASHHGNPPLERGIMWSRHQRN